MKSKSFSKYIPEIGVFLLLGIFPLFMTKGYSNITVSKFGFFAAVTFISGVLSIALCNNRRRPGRPKKKAEKSDLMSRIRSADKLDLAFVAYVLLGLIAVIVSPYKFSSLVGYAGRYMGFDFVLAIGLLYFFVSRYYVINEKAFVVFSISSIVCTVFAVIQFMGLDLFSLRHGARHFISTIGNVNVFGSYVCLAFAVMLYIICFGKKSRFSALYIVSAVLLAFSVIMSNSDSCCLGVVAAVWFVVLLSLDDCNHFGKTLISVGAFFLATVIFGLIAKVDPDSVPISFTGSVLSSPYMLISAAVFAALGILTLKFRLNNRFLHILKIIYIVISALALASVIGIIVYFSAIDRSTDLGTFENYLRFSDDWGTQRGFVWKTCLKSFAAMPFINKLFGYGEDTVVLLLAENFKDEMLATGFYTDNAHNELLQQLLTNGIFGLAAYLSIVILALKKLLEKRKQSVFYGAAAIAVFAYCCQSMVNISQPITTPLLFLFISLAGADCPEKSEK